MSPGCFGGYSTGWGEGGAFDPEPRAQRGAEVQFTASGGYSRPLASDLTACGRAYRLTQNPERSEGPRYNSRPAETTVGPSLRSGFWVGDGLV